jgi:hypothetical protein
MDGQTEMKPLLFMSPAKADGELDEFDQCSLCGRRTQLLIMFRAVDLLISVCDNCITAQRRAFDVMMNDRLKRRMEP